MDNISDLEQQFERVVELINRGGQGHDPETTLLIDNARERLSAVLGYQPSP